MNLLYVFLIENGLMLLLGTTLIMLLGTILSYCFRAPIYKQRTTEFTILASLLWLGLACVPLPRYDISPLILQNDSTRDSENNSISKINSQPDLIEELVVEPEVIPLESLQAEVIQPVDNDFIIETQEEPYELSEEEKAKLLNEILVQEEPVPQDETVTIRPEINDIKQGLEISLKELNPQEIVNLQKESAHIVEPVEKIDPISKYRVEELPVSVPVIIEETEPVTVQSKTTQAENLPASNISSLILNLKNMLFKNLGYLKNLVLEIYLIGALLAFFWVSIGQFSLNRTKRKSHSSDKWVSNLFNEIKNTQIVRDIELRISASTDRAMTFGIWKPVILLPESLCQKENRETVKQVLLHEMAHIQQYDAVGRVLFNIAYPLFYFHPLYWWLRINAYHSAELVADESAALKSSRTEYAEALVSLIKNHPNRAVLMNNAMPIFKTPSSFYRRMEMLVTRTKELETRCSRFWKCVGLFTFSVILITATSVLGIRQLQADPEIKSDLKTSKTAVVGADLEEKKVVEENKVIDELKETTESVDPLVAETIEETKVKEVKPTIGNTSKTVKTPQKKKDEKYANDFLKFLTDKNTVYQVRYRVSFSSSYVHDENIHSILKSRVDDGFLVEITGDSSKSAKGTHVARTSIGDLRSIICDVKTTEKEHRKLCEELKKSKFNFIATITTKIFKSHQVSQEKEMLITSLLNNKFIKKYWGDLRITPDVSYDPKRNRIHVVTTPQGHELISSLIDYFQGSKNENQPFVLYRGSSIYSINESVNYGRDIVLVKINIDGSDLQLASTLVGAMMKSENSLYQFDTLGYGSDSFVIANRNTLQKIKDVLAEINKIPVVKSSKPDFDVKVFRNKKSLTGVYLGNEKPTIDFIYKTKKKNKYADDPYWQTFIVENNGVESWGVANFKNRIQYIQSFLKYHEDELPSLRLKLYYRVSNKENPSEFAKVIGYIESSEFENPPNLTRGKFTHEQLIENQIKDIYRRLTNREPSSEEMESLLQIHSKTKDSIEFAYKLAVILQLPDKSIHSWYACRKYLKELDQLQKAIKKDKKDLSSPNLDPTFENFFLVSRRNQKLKRLVESIANGINNYDMNKPKSKAKPVPIRNNSFTKVLSNGNVKSNWPIPFTTFKSQTKPKIISSTGHVDLISLATKFSDLVREYQKTEADLDLELQGMVTQSKSPQILLSQLKSLKGQIQFLQKMANIYNRSKLAKLKNLLQEQERLDKLSKKGVITKNEIRKHQLKMIQAESDVEILKLILEDDVAKEIMKKAKTISTPKPEKNSKVEKVFKKPFKPEVKKEKKLKSVDERQPVGTY